jgi:hypothetical protein
LSTFSRVWRFASARRVGARFGVSTSDRVAVLRFALFRGGDFGRSYSNKLMRLRVLMQAVAIAVLVAAAWYRGQG